MTQALLSDLARVKAIFQLRAIMLHMGLEPASTPPALVGDTGEGKPSRPSVAVAAAGDATVSNLVSPDPVETITHTDRTGEVTHRDLSQHAEACVSNRNEIVPHGKAI